MEALRHRDFLDWLSLYVDGELGPEDQKEFESYLESHPEAAKELDAYRRMQSALSGQGKLPPDPAFWTKFSRRLENKREEKENLLPFPRKFLPAAVSLAGAAALLVVVVLYGERSTIFDFLNKKSEQVQTAIHESLLQGSIVPLFAGLDRDHVLRYALFGTLPLDEHSDRALRVDETSEQGYRIEMGSTVKENAPQVTVNDLIAEVEPTPHQARAIDSVLDEAKQQIETSAFYAENNAIAIDPELTKLNRMTLVSIASKLDARQRRKFDVFLKKHRSAYLVGEEKSGVWQSRPVREPVAKSRAARVEERPYVVVTPDTFVYTTLGVNLAQLNERQEEIVRLRQQSEENIDRLAEQLHRLQERLQAPSHPDEQPIVVQGGSGFVSIRIHGALVQGPEDSALQVIVRSPEQPRIFRHEFETGTGRVTFDYSVRISGELDSLVEAEMSRARDFQRHLREQDSIVRAAARSGGVVAPTDTVRRKKRF